MKIRNQKTLKKEVIVAGIGAHTGKKSLIRLLPTKCNSGVNFISGRGVIPATFFTIGDGASSTNLVSGNFSVDTVEHLLSCLYGLCIDNVDVQVIGPEIPIGDGSARHFYDAILEAGVVELDCPKVALVITKTTRVKEKPNRLISISPAKNFCIDCSLDWHPNIVGKYTYTHKNNNYSEIAYARTFADRKYEKELKLKGLSKGTEFGVTCIDINNPGEIIENEFVKHKVLDIIGDLSLLCGMDVQGKVTSVNSGHAMHHELMKGLLDGR